MSDCCGNKPGSKAMSSSCCGGKRTVLLYACSGGANVAEIADKAAPAHHQDPVADPEQFRQFRRNHQNALSLGSQFCE